MGQQHGMHAGSAGVPSRKEGYNMLPILVRRMVTQADYRSEVVMAIEQVSAAHGLAFSAEDRGMIDDVLRGLSSMSHITGAAEPNPWPGGPSFTDAAVDPNP